MMFDPLTLWLCLLIVLVIAFIGWTGFLYSKHHWAIERDRIAAAKHAGDEARKLETARILADERKHQFTVQKEAADALKALTEGIDAQLADVKKQISHINMRDARLGGGRG